MILPQVLSLKKQTLKHARKCLPEPNRVILEYKAGFYKPPIFVYILLYYSAVFPDCLIVTYKIFVKEFVEFKKKLIYF